MTREFIDFIKTHESEDTARLLLSAARYPSIDMAAAVQQIEGRRTAREKWPSLLECDDFLYPPRLNREQASSEATARHKAAICYRRFDKHGQHGENHSRPLRIVDLTGGMGIDTFALAGWRSGEPSEVEVDYVERDEELCSLAQSNAKTLGLSNVNVHCGDSLEWLRQQDSRFDLIFVDPARRDIHGRKVAAFVDCTPDILAHREMLFSKGRKIVIKASPMIDIDMACHQLGHVYEVHIVGVGGECKEVLFIGTSDAVSTEPEITCWNIPNNLNTQNNQSNQSNQSTPISPTMVFTRTEEATCVPRYCTALGRYLYIPDATLMKAGAFNLIAVRYDIAKLARNTHLYTSDERVGEFPGRVLEAVQEMKCNRKDAQHWIPDGKAHVLTRNYPTAAADLQRQLGLKEGGDLFVVATTVGREKKMFLCKQA